MNPLNWTVYVFALHLLSLDQYVCTTLHYFTHDQQVKNLYIAFLDCQKRLQEDSLSRGNGTSDFCPMHFDGWGCWPATRPNTTVSQQCPDYVNKFDSSETAHRYCDSHGNWSYDHSMGLYRVDYTRCTHAAEKLDLTAELTSGGDIVKSPLVQRHIGGLRIIFTVGYSISVTGLCIALIIMILLRKLHCPRNMIHMNMFASFILRGGVALLMEYLYSRLSGPQNSVISGTVESTSYQDEAPINKTRWECKLLASLWMYSRLSNYVWIFVEGFYLHTLIFINTFSDRSSIKWFLITGWGSPLLFAIPWVLVRIYVDDFMCWTAYETLDNRKFRWIIEAPIVLLIVANFIFFLIIIRLLFTKLKASGSRSRETRIYRYIKLAKSTLVLIPLFGAHYIVFLFGEFFDKNETLELIRFYFDALFMSFQGLMVSILFCFMNGEVRAEIIKKWKKWRTVKDMRISSSHPNTITLRTSIASDYDSVSPPNKGESRNSSIQSNKPNGGNQTQSVDETQLLLSIDDNQNELHDKESTSDSNV